MYLKSSDQNQSSDKNQSEIYCFLFINVKGDYKSCAMFACTKTCIYTITEMKN